VNIIFGTVIDDTLGDTVRATIIATDFVGGIQVSGSPSEIFVHKAETLDVPKFVSADLTDKIPIFHRSKT